MSIPFASFASFASCARRLNGRIWPDPAVEYGGPMSIEVPIDELFDEVARWGSCYLLTVSDDERPHLLALHPSVDADDGILRFDAGGGRACSNAAARPRVSLVFPPAVHADGYSLVVDGDATVRGALVEVSPTWAVLHRPAP